MRALSDQAEGKAVFAQIKHIGIRSENPKAPGRFYEALFGMRTGENMTRGGGAVNVGDGYLGININPRSPGCIAGLEHFGITVESVDVVDARLRERYPSVHLLKRPSNRPFAGLSSHDPAGITFDLSWEELDHRGGVYVDPYRDNPRHVDHIALRVLDPEMVARFYTEVFELEEQEKASDDPNFYLSDGRVTLIVCPWRIADYEGGSVIPPGVEHFGFKVESIDALTREMDELAERDPELAPKPWGNYGTDRESRLGQVSQCKYGDHLVWDPDGVFIDLVES